METVIDKSIIVHSEPFIPKAIVNGLISTVILWAFWTPFIVFLAIPLVAAQLKDGVCMGLDQSYEISQIPLKTNATASQNLMNNDPKELKDANAKLTYTFIFTSIIVITLCLYVAYRMIVGYNLDYKNIVLFNIVMALIIVTIEMSFFTGVSMRYLPFIPTDIIGSLSSQVTGYYNELNTATSVNSRTPPTGAIAVPIGSDGRSYEVRWTPPSVVDPSITYDINFAKVCPNIGYAYAEGRASNGETSTIVKFDETTPSEYFTCSGGYMEGVVCASTSSENGGCAEITFL